MAGLLTGALTLAAHSVGGGDIPVGAAIVQLFVVAAVVGGLAACLSRATDLRTMVCLLAAGQLAGHCVLAAQGHVHSSGVAVAGWAMVAAHVAAIFVGAALIGAGDRLIRALSRVVRTAAPPIPQLASAPRMLTEWSADQPMRWTLLLASSMSHRGPPASARR